MDKKGYMLTLEAVVAIVIIFLFIYYIVPDEIPENEPKNIDLIQNAILDEVSSNLALRNALLEEPPNRQIIRDAIDNLLKARYEYEFVIKNADIFPSSIELSVLPTNKQIYGKSIVISATADNIGPRVFYLYLWQE